MLVALGSRARPRTSAAYGHRGYTDGYAVHWLVIGVGANPAVRTLLDLIIHGTDYDITAGLLESCMVRVHHCLRGVLLLCLGLSCTSLGLGVGTTTRRCGMGRVLPARGPSYTLVSTCAEAFRLSAAVRRRALGP